MKENKTKTAVSKNEQKTPSATCENNHKKVPQETNVYKNFIRNSLDADRWCLTRL